MNDIQMLVLGMSCIISGKKARVQTISLYSEVLSGPKEPLKLLQLMTLKPKGNWRSQTKKLNEKNAENLRRI